MTRAVYIAASDAATRKVAIALGLAELLSRRVGQIGIFRPVVVEGRADSSIDTVTARFKAIGATGVTYEDVHRDPERATADIVAAYRALAAQCEAVVIVGTDYTDAGAPTELEFNATLAAHLGAPVVLLVNGQNRTPEEIAVSTAMSAKELANEHATLLAVLVPRVDAPALEPVRAVLN